MALLPIEAFDGIPVSNSFVVMQKEWEIVLTDSQSIMETCDQDLLSLTRRRLLYCEQRIAAHHKMVYWYECWTKRTEDGYFLEPLRTQILDQYRLQLEHHQTRLRIENSQNILIEKRLNYLESIQD